jgi:SAM-dependent methyltransferase
MAALYSRAAPDYVKRGAPRFIYTGRRLVELAGVGVGDAVLDLGSGRGAVLFPAADRVRSTGRVVGIDLSEGMTEQTRSDVVTRNLERITLRVMDVEHMDFADATFTHALGSFVVFFFADIQRALSQIRRVLQPGGVVGFSFERGVDPRWAWYEDLLRDRGVFERTPRTPGNGEIRRQGALSAALHDAGFVATREFEEDVELGYPDVEAWWASLWTHGSRSALEALSEPELAEVRAVCHATAALMRGPNGLLELHHFVYVIARKPIAIDIDAGPSAG